jgi:hypothetical protein
MGSESPFVACRSATGLLSVGGPIVAGGAVGVTSMGSLEGICGDAEEDEGSMGIDLCMLDA